MKTTVTGPGYFRNITANKDLPAILLPPRRAPQVRGTSPSPRQSTPRSSGKQPRGPRSPTCLPPSAGGAAAPAPQLWARPFPQADAHTSSPRPGSALRGSGPPPFGAPQRLPRPDAPRAPRFPSSRPRAPRSARARVSHHLRRTLAPFPPTAGGRSHRPAAAIHRSVLFRIRFTLSPRPSKLGRRRGPRPRASRTFPELWEPAGAGDERSGAARGRRPPTGPYAGAALRPPPRRGCGTHLRRSPSAGEPRGSAASRRAGTTCPGDGRLPRPRGRKRSGDPEPTAAAGRPLRGATPPRAPLSLLTRPRGSRRARPRAARTRAGGEAGRGAASRRAPAAAREARAAGAAGWRAGRAVAAPPRARLKKKKKRGSETWEP